MLAQLARLGIGALLAAAIAITGHASSAYAVAPDAIDLTVEIPSAGSLMRLPLVGVYSGLSIDWGDGLSGAGTSHTYANPGTYAIKVSAPTSGSVGFSISSPFAIAFGWQGSAFVKSVTAWNNLTSIRGAFSKAAILESVPNYLPSSITSLGWVFNGAVRFNQDISSWDTSNVTDLNYTFNGATSFNQPIGSWNISKVTLLQNTFAGATSFDQDISSWNTSQVTNMQSTFAGATAFNHPLQNWDTSSVTTMANLFSGATSFNQPLQRWNTQNVTLMPYMFSGASKFNQPINSWNTAKATDTTSMFSGAREFNQPLVGLNTREVKTVDYMFQGASAFDQSLGTLNLSKVGSTSLKRILTGANLSAQKMSETIIGWANGWQFGGISDHVPLGVSTEFNLKYLSNNASLAAVATLTNTYGWNLTAEKPAFLVSYFVGSATGTTPPTAAVEVGGITQLPDATGLNLPGFHLAGWSDGANSWSPNSSYRTNVGDVLFSALWLPDEFTVSFDAHQGTAVESQQTFTNGAVQAPSTPSRTGYSFLGWFENPENGAPIVFPYVHHRLSGFTLFAQWAPISHSVIYSTGAGYGTPPNSLTTYTESTFIVAGAISMGRFGYNFAGWTDGVRSWTPGEVYQVGDGDVTLTATWIPEQYSVIFLPQSKTEIPSQTTYVNHFVFAPSTTPVKPGYSFTGWFLEPEGGTALKFPFEFNQQSNLTLFGQWQLIPVATTWRTITFTDEYGAGTPPAPITAEAGSQLLLPNPTSLAREGFRFWGWSDGVVQYQLGSFLKLGNSNTILWAIWQKEPNPNPPALLVPKPEPRFDGNKLIVEVPTASAEPTALTIMTQFGPACLISLPATSCTIDDPKPGRNYIFTAWAFDSSGTSVASTPSESIFVPYPPLSLCRISVKFDLDTLSPSKTGVTRINKLIKSLKSYRFSSDLEATVTSYVVSGNLTSPSRAQSLLGLKQARTVINIFKSTGLALKFKINVQTIPPQSSSVLERVFIELQTP